ncbi:hypothetical protein YC2023_105665 [Brassica napus]
MKQISQRRERSKALPSDGYSHQGGDLKKANVCRENHERRKIFSDKIGRNAHKFGELRSHHLEEVKEEESCENTTTLNETFDVSYSRRDSRKKREATQ